MRITRLNELIDGSRKVRGRWVLSKRHEIEYRSLDREETLHLKAAIISSEPKALVIAYTERRVDGRAVTSIARLRGHWQLDTRNRINFEVARTKSVYDILTFKGAWSINAAQQVIYQYEQTSLKTRVKKIHTLSFDGYWDVSDDKRLTYVLSAASDSAFKIRGAFQTKSILAKAGEIRYQAGVEVAGTRKTKSITLFGKWKMSRDLALAFEIEYAEGRKRVMVFGAEYALTANNKIAARLITRSGARLGVEVVLTREFDQDRGGVFLRLYRNLSDAGVEAGVNLSW